MLDRKIRLGPELPRTTVETVRDPSEDILQEIRELGAEIRTRYPDKEHYGEWVYRLLTAGKERRPNVVFLGRAANKLAGFLIGQAEGQALTLQFLLVDPIYQNSGIARDLMNEAKKTFSPIRFSAAASGGGKHLSEQARVRRDEALVRFYEDLDFSIDTSRPSLRGIPMIWKRESV